MMQTRREFLATAAMLSAGTRALGGQRSAVTGRTAGEETTIEGIRLCWCPPGSFRMGSPPDEPGRRADESPVDVTLRRGFWMGKFEVTQSQWQAAGAPAPSRPTSEEFGLGGDVPIYWINFSAAERFCALVTAAARRSGALTGEWAFRLPTEAQWEYAARAGTTTATAFGDGLTAKQANLKGGAGKAVTVGSYPPNRWGLCDMHGNVFEWCRDWYHAQLPGGVDPDLSARQGVPNRDGSYSRVRRGGAWNDGVEFCRSACRLRYEPDRVSDHIGFRVVVVQV